MNHKVVAVILFALSLLAILFGYFLLSPWLIGLCPIDSYCLDDSLNFGIGYPLYLSIRILPLIFFTLIFVRKEVFSTWWKIITPLSILLLFIIISTPYEYHGWIQLWPDRTAMTHLMVYVFVIVSIIVILWKYWRLSRTPKVKPAQIG